MAAAARITDEDLALFQEQGFLLKRSFFSPEEAALLSAVARDDPFGRSAEGRRVELLGLPKGDPERPKATLYDALCYSERMVRAMERLLLPPSGAMRSLRDKVVLHHRCVPPACSVQLYFSINSKRHRKIIMKDEESSHPSANAGQAGADGAGSRGGGFGGGNRFAWHQDFAYWTEGNPYNRPVMPSPDVATAAIAIDRSGPENGALQMLKGSHKLGLLGYVAEPWGERYAEDASVQSALAAGCDIVVCEQEPGDVCFFNCLTFRPHHFPHSALRLSSNGWGAADCSESNTSPHPRWAFLCAYDNWANALRYSTHTISSNPRPVCTLSLTHP